MSVNAVVAIIIAIPIGFILFGMWGCIIKECRRDDDVFSHAIGVGIGTLATLVALSLIASAWVGKP